MRLEVHFIIPIFFQIRIQSVRKEREIRTDNKKKTRIKQERIRVGTMFGEDSVCGPPVDVYISSVRVRQRTDHTWERVREIERTTHGPNQTR